MEVDQGVNGGKEQGVNGGKEQGVNGGTDQGVNEVNGYIYNERMNG